MGIPLGLESVPGPVGGSHTHYKVEERLELPILIAMMIGPKGCRHLKVEGSFAGVPCISLYSGKI